MNTEVNVMARRELERADNELLELTAVIDIMIGGCGNVNGETVADALSHIKGALQGVRARLDEATGIIQQVHHIA